MTHPVCAGHTHIRTLDADSVADGMAVCARGVPLVVRTTVGLGDDVVLYGEHGEDVRLPWHATVYEIRPEDVPNPDAEWLEDEAAAEYEAIRRAVEGR